MTILKAEFIANYKAAEKRALPASNGLSFLEHDRVTLDAQRRSLGLDSNGAAKLIVGITGRGAWATAYGRFAIWKRQVNSGEIRLCVATGEHIGKTGGMPRATQVVAFDGRIKTKADIQPAFNKAAVQLVKLGITSPEQAVAYLANGFAHAKVEQKIDIQADRFVADLRTVGMTKDQAKQAFDRALAQL